MEAKNYSELTREQRRKLRLEYVKYQNGLCYYCLDPLKGKPASHIQKIPIDLSLFPKNFLFYPVHLQHDHDTDKTEGAVHAYCNAVMWQYEGR